MLLLSTSTLYASEDFDRQQIEQRIKPVGQVNIEGGQKSSAKQQTAPAEQKKTAANEPPGKATYEKYCSTCHRDGIAGAPKLQSADWKPRLDAKKMDGLIASATKGLNAMPPKGTCAECSEEDLKQAIEYMLPKS
ncbi:c-type cytochrome [Legionella jordanis]|nr:c-type cytochrome [Legionella jordanis]